MHGFAKERHTPYVHIVGVHAPEWNRQLGPLRKFGGEQLKNLNDQFKRGHLRQTKGHDCLNPCAETLQAGTAEQSNRRQQKNAERVPKQGCQGPYRGYRAKEQAEERKAAAKDATAAATSLYANPLSTLSVSQLQHQYQDVTGQRKFK